jgi:hypothetical protein
LLNVIPLNVIPLNVILLNAILLNIAAPFSTGSTLRRSQMSHLSVSRN